MNHYVIPRYPVHLIDVVRVVDGSRVTIRPTLPQDAELQREFFRRLLRASPASTTGAILRCWPSCSTKGARP
jgi:hypothetical protein